MGWPVGYGVALFTEDKTRHRFVTDFKVGDQQVSEVLRRLTFVYSPETPTELYGRPIEYLTRIDTFACRFDALLKQMGVEMVGPANLQISLLVNGVEVVALRDQRADPKLLLEQQAILPAGESFKHIPEAYASYLHAKRTP